MPQSLKSGFGAICERMDACAEELNALDGKLGDGDLGVTLQRGARDLRAALDDPQDDLGVFLMKCAQAFTRTSGSSFGTLLATGLMAGAKSLRGRRETAWASCRRDGGCARRHAEAGEGRIGGAPA